jgi:hypothetical protein
MGAPTRVHKRGCGAGRVRGLGRESRHRRDVPSVRQFWQHLWPLASFTGTVNLDFSNNFAEETTKSIKISIQGRPVFNQSVSLSVGPSVGIVNASNSAGDTLALWFAAPQSGTWAGFNAGGVSFGEVF